MNNQHCILLLLGIIWQYQYRNENGHATINFYRFQWIVNRRHRAIGFTHDAIWWWMEKESLNQLKCKLQWMTDDAKHDKWKMSAIGFGRVLVWFASAIGVAFQLCILYGFTSGASSNGCIVCNATHDSHITW